MSNEAQPSQTTSNRPEPEAANRLSIEARPLLNYSLSTVCPACTAPTYRLACKVRCPRCGFMWDCSEL
jgi:hypothetical protein